MKTIKICPKCKTKDVIHELNYYNLKIECINYCGIAKNKYVAIVDNKPIICETKEEFIKKIKEK